MAETFRLRIYNKLPRFIRAFIGVITPFISSRGPPCGNPGDFLEAVVAKFFDQLPPPGREQWMKRAKQNSNWTRLGEFCKVGLDMWDPLMKRIGILRGTLFLIPKDQAKP